MGGQDMRCNRRRGWRESGQGCCGGGGGEIDGDATASVCVF